jgi:hypothetical protein
VAADNHLGPTPAATMHRIVTLSEQLVDENAPLALDAILRCCSTLTNQFAFATVERLLAPWIIRPIATVGLKNYGKLYSTRGQLAAFQRQWQVAFDHFNTAITAFQRLSNQESIKREHRQTGLYRFITACDGNLYDSATQREKLRKLLDDQTIQSLARTAEGSGERQTEFNHYIVLRLLACYPGYPSEQATYLAVIDEWGSGDAHPWPLVHFYRGVLLKCNGDEATANTYFDLAIRSALSSAHGGILLWMAQVFAAASQRAIAMTEQQQVELARLPIHEQNLQYLKSAPDVTNPLELQQWLDRLLPFNFH